MIAARSESLHAGLDRLRAVRRASAVDEVGAAGCERPATPPARTRAAPRQDAGRTAARRAVGSSTMARRGVQSAMAVGKRSLRGPAGSGTATAPAFIAPR